MPSQNITNSANVSVLTSKVVTDICLGKFHIDLTLSQWIGVGATLVQGAKIKITNPFGVVVKDFGAGFDIVPPMTSVYDFDIPMQGNNYQYGLYKIEVQLTDAAGVVNTVTANVTPCAPNSKDKTKLYGDIIAQIVGDCTQGTVTIYIDAPPTYKGIAFESQTLETTLDYPTGSGVVPLDSPYNAFTVALYEGWYKLVGDVCATYNAGDNIYYQVPYKINCEKNVLCRVDFCCVYEKLEQLNSQLSDECPADKILTTNIILDALRLITTIQLGSDCGEDVSKFIEELEVLLKCNCSCSAAAGTPFTANPLVPTYSIVGCNTSFATVGLTTTWTIDNYEYVIDVNPNSNFITASAPALLGCTKTQQLTFNLAGHYAAMKGLITGVTGEHDYWASIINNTINTLPAGLLTCLGVSDAVWNAKTFRDKFIAVIEKMCACCAGSTCTATISGNTATATNQDTLIEWSNTLGTGVFSIDIYVDNVFIDTVLAPLEEYVVSGYNDGSPHTYILIAKCSNGAPGNTLTASFTHAGCNAIPPPSLSSNNVPNATCPYNLVPLAPAQFGFTVEWHNANNTNSLTLVSDPTAVTSGTYFAFYKENSTGCYSTGSQVIITCAVAGNCTEPLNLLVEQGTGTNHVITFSSAATPPPSYLVYRRLASDPDVPGSYVTIGTPTFNINLNKWTITDATGAANTLYVYKAESQCSDATRPDSQYTFARIVCPNITATPGTDQISYSFVNSGGDIDKYEVELYNATGSILLQTEVENPAFSNPITGLFVGTTPDTYRVVLNTFIGSYKKVCSTIYVTVTSGDNFLVNNTVAGAAQIDSVTPAFYLISVGAFPVTAGQQAIGNHNGYSAAISSTVTNGLVGQFLQLRQNAVALQSVAMAVGTNNVTFNAFTFSSGDDMEIRLTT